MGKDISNCFSRNTSIHMMGIDVLAADTIPPAGTVYTDTDTIKEVQKALKAKGFDPGTIDGKFGPNTSNAIKAMQKALGSSVQPGVIDYGVLMALSVAAPAPPSGNSTPKAPSTMSVSNVPLKDNAPNTKPAISNIDNGFMATWEALPTWQKAIAGVSAGLAVLGIGIGVAKALTPRAS